MSTEPLAEARALHSAGSTASPHISVCVITFNHARYIEEALQSVLSQEVRHPTEILIAEDESSDGTREIVQGYIDRYPDLIRPIWGSRDTVRYIRGRATGRAQFLRVLRSARGRYVALLEGDDAWVGTTRLQRQVELLAGSEDLVMTGGDVRVVSNAGSNIGSHGRSLLTSRGRHGFDQVVTGLFMNTATLVFERQAMLDSRVLDRLDHTQFGDWVLALRLSCMGDGFCFPEVMAEYRYHGRGTSQSLDFVNISESILIMLRDLLRDGISPNPRATHQLLARMCARRALRGITEASIHPAQELRDAVRHTLASLTGDGHRIEVLSKFRRRILARDAARVLHELRSH